MNATRYTIGATLIYGAEGSRSVSNNLTQVGNEFSSVEALWSQFENFMGKDGDGEVEEEGKREECGQEEGEAGNTQLEEGDADEIGDRR